MIEWIYFVKLCGFCVGVVMVIQVVEKVVVCEDKLVIVYYFIVYNYMVVEWFFEGGWVYFVEDLDVVDVLLDSGDIVIFSVYGISLVVCEWVCLFGFLIIDVICLLVIKVYIEVKKYVCEGYIILFIGDSVGYQEVIGMWGEVLENIILVGVFGKIGLGLNDLYVVQVFDFEWLVVFIQMIFSVDDICKMVDILKVCFFVLVVLLSEDLCYVIKNWQDVVKNIVFNVDVFLVLIFIYLSNGMRLFELVEVECGCVYWLEIVVDLIWFE